jgi:O-antigen/teichoic acid export membrane protein
MLQSEIINLKKVLYPSERRKLNYHMKQQLPQFSLEYTSGTIIYSEIYLNVITIWLMGERINTQFMILLAIAQILYNICNIGSDSVHALDYKEKYSFGTMLVFRFYMIVWMFILGGGFLLFNGYLVKRYYFLLFLLILSDKALESFAQCCEAEFARRDRAIRNTPSIVYRQLFPLIVYTIVLIASRDLMVAYGLCILIKIPFVFIFDFRVIHHKKKVRWRYEKKKSLSIINDALPDFIPTISCSFLLYVPRIVLGLSCGGKYLSYYQECFILAQIIFEIIYILVKPRFTSITKMWSEGKYEVCRKSIITFSAGIGIVTIVSVALMSAMGPSLLRVIFSGNFKNSSVILYWFAAALGIRLLNIEMYFVLVIRNAGLFAAMIRALCAIEVTIASVNMIPSGGLFMAVTIYTIGRAAECMLLFACVGVTEILRTVNKKREA